MALANTSCIIQHLWLASIYY